jgi:nicotinamide mononucleotide adenylyltransferase
MKFINYINEAANRKNALGMYIGRFQGFTIGHKAVLDLMSKTHDKSVLFLVKGKKTSLDKDKNPFSFETQQFMVKKCLPANVKLEILEGSVVPALEEFMQTDTHDTYVLYSGPDRLAGYNEFKKYFKKQDKSLVVLNTEMMVPRQEHVSGTKFREALRSNDLDKFKTVAPKELWNSFV